MEERNKGLMLNKDAIDVLVTNVIPTTKYFEFRFDTMQKQVDRIEHDMSKGFEKVDQRFTEMQNGMDQRFEKVDSRFTEMENGMDQRFTEMQTDVDKQFEKVDKQFEKVDKKFDQMIASIDKLGDKLEGRDAHQRSFTLKMFTISITISFLGVLGIFAKVARMI